MQNVRKTYECSTSHLPEKTARAIDDGSFAKPAAMQNEYGWLIYVPEMLAELPDGVGCDAFRVIMSLAIDAGCDYVQPEERNILCSQEPSPKAPKPPAGKIHSTKFDIAIQLEKRTKMSERSPDLDVTAINKSGRKVRIGTAWNETGNTCVTRSHARTWPICLPNGGSALIVRQSIAG